MSPRNDTYLSLCLAQAELSPIHYRHGSIIVRGGKIIGQGFNAYRPGFDGGALKTGTLPTSALDGPAIAELKERPRMSKMKHEMESQSKATPERLDSQQRPSSSPFTPFKGTGCGYNANTPLSMHSEMMAIRSALSLSSGTQSSQASTRAAKSLQKPCFALQGDSNKRKARARGLQAYAKAACEEAASSSGGTLSGARSSIQKQGFEPAASQPGVEGERPQVPRQGGGQWVLQGEKSVRGVAAGSRCREMPCEQDSVRGSLWVSIQRSLSSSPFFHSLST
jgi:hypothetical protein